MPLISGQVIVAGSNPRKGLPAAKVTCKEGKKVTMATDGAWTCYVTNANTYHFTATCSGYQTITCPGTSNAPVTIPMTPTAV